ncbi:porin [Cupriavidus sp. TA19]|uniref:porin n=1 Tax=unclassified Cupriavidus TaxID=2640874 RepID=UPI00272946C3|nr:porin [Cupriavidus sp. TA19]GLC97296.1 porin [Cupriavidus sp. TA19]
MPKKFNTNRIVRYVSIAFLTSLPVRAIAVELYGVVDAFVGSTKSSGDPGSVGGLQSGGMSTSFWGLTGSEMIGDGVKANFRIEGYYLSDTGASGRSATDTLLSRNAYVGLEGKFGEIRLGRLANPMFLATGQFDPFGGSTKFSPIMNPLWSPQYGRYIAGDSGWNNAIGYYTPEFSGLSGRFLYAFGEAVGTNTSNNAVAMLYLNKSPFTATVAFQRTRFGPGFPAGGSAQNVVSAGMAYDFRGLKVFLQYSGTRASGVEFRTDSYMVGATVPFLEGRFMFAATQTNINSVGRQDAKRRDAGLGYLYALSKRTDVYISTIYDKLSDQGSGVSTGIGIRHRF